MIGFEKKPTGRMGNVLIQYVFLRQLAEKIGVDYFHPTLPYAQYFKNFDGKKRPIKELLKKKWIVSNAYISAVGVEKFIQEAKEKKEYSIILDPPVLGHLLEWEKENQMRYIQVKERYEESIIYREHMGRKKIAIHFRATDFREWDSNAVLDFEYYKKAIDYLMEEYKEDNPIVYLFTDENEFDTYQQVMTYLKEMKVDYVVGDAKRHMMKDFVGMSECDLIISSPSTFAICAALLGKEDKLIIHSEKWVDYCVNRGEDFWRIVRENKNIYYKTYLV